MRRRLFSSFASQNNTTFPLLSWNRRRPCLIQPSAEVGLLGICEDRNSSFKQGSSAAPSLIRKYFREPAVNTWCELGFDVDKHIVDYGDVVPLTNDHAGIEAASSASLRKILEAGLVPLTLGGDHSISFSTIKTIRKHIGQPLVIIHFDAHPGSRLGSYCRRSLVVFLSTNNNPYRACSCCLAFLLFCLQTFTSITMVTSTHTHVHLHVCSKCLVSVLS